MRECGNCTLCCKLPRISEVEKLSNEWCRHCAVGSGCRIYPERPQVCRTFECWWLRHPEMPEEMRPDRVHMYATSQGEGSVLSVYVDPEFADWRVSPVVGYLGAGRHLAVLVANQVTFLASRELVRPEKIMLEWTL